MNEKDHETIARGIRRARLAGKTIGHRIGNADAAIMIAAELSEIDPSFDRTKFLRDCGLEYYGPRDAD